jgi:hypothetical protein
MLDELAIAQKRIEALEAFIDKSITTKRLRDEFAMAALPLIIDEDVGFRVVAICAYEIADAMMAEREKTK